MLLDRFNALPGLQVRPNMEGPEIRTSVVGLKMAKRERNKERKRKIKIRE